MDTKDMVINSYKCLKYLRNNYFRNCKSSEDFMWLQATDHALQQMEEYLGLRQRVNEGLDKSECGEGSAVSD